jgi:hypothetical protein
LRTIYIDSDFCCHAVNDGSLTAVETDAFDGKCDAYIEGYRFVPNGKIWTREDGVEIHGEMISPWKPYSELESAQREVERQMLAEYEALIDELYAEVTE